MEVILLEKVQNLGNLGEKVRVKPGYARNFLIPKGKAAQATAANLEAFEKRRAELEKAQAETLAAAQARAASAAAALPIAPGSPQRFIGTRPLSMSASYFAETPAVISERMMPGRISKTEMPVSASRSASPWLKAASPALVMQ